MNSRTSKLVGRALLPLCVATMVSLAACGDGGEASPEHTGEIAEALPLGGIVVTNPVPIPLPTAPLPMLTVPPLALVSFGYINPFDGLNVDVVSKIAGKLTWPSGFDVNPHRVHFQWKIQGTFSASEAAKLVARDGYTVVLWVNGRLMIDTHHGANLGDYYMGVTQGGDDDFGCPIGNTCIDVTVDQDALPPGKAWDLSIDFSQTGYRGSSQTVTGHVLPNPNGTSYFLDKIAPIFQSQRCTHCHSLGSQDLLVAQHKNVAQLKGKIIETSVPPNGTQLRCAQVSGCHLSIDYSVPGKKFTVTEWMTPKFDQGIDWTGKTPYQICQKVKSRFIANPAKMAAHFFDDARIGWAVHDAVTPDGVQQSKAPPGNYAAFVALMRPWIDGGQACP
jgi:hypothetical protein